MLARSVADRKWRSANELPMPGRNAMHIAITVHLTPGGKVRLSSRALVWVWGTFRDARYPKTVGP